jgi:hypothetical protein
MLCALFFVKAAEPAFSLVIGAMPAEGEMNLMDKVQSELSVLLLFGFAIEPKEIADGEGICP